MKISTAKSDTETTSESPSQLWTGWSRVVSSHQLSSPASSAWCSSRLQKILMTKQRPRQISHWWQPVQLEATTGPNNDPGALIRDLLFADVAALVAHTKRASQLITACFAVVAQLFGIEVSLKKTEVLHQPARTSERVPPSSHQNQRVRTEICRPAHLPGMHHLLRCQDRQGNWQQTGADWQRQIVHLADCSNACGTRNTWRKAPISVYIEPLYGPPSCTPLSPRSPTVATYVFSSASISAASPPSLTNWSDFVTDIEVLEQAEVTSIEAMFLKTQLRWAGHVSRMHGRSSPAQVRAVWQTTYWPSRQRGIEEELQRLSE